MHVHRYAPMHIIQLNIHIFNFLIYSADVDYDSDVIDVVFNPGEDREVSII